MIELRRLILDGGDDPGMAMPRRGDGDAGGEVEKQIRVHVLDDGAGAAGADERIDARVGWRHVFLVALQEGARLRAREVGLDGGDLASFELPHKNLV